MDGMADHENVTITNIEWLFSGNDWHKLPNT